MIFFLSEIRKLAGLSGSLALVHVFTAVLGLCSLSLRRKHSQLSSGVGTGRDRLGQGGGVGGESAPKTDTLYPQPHSSVVSPCWCARDKPHSFC